MTENKEQDKELLKPEIEETDITLDSRDEDTDDNEDEDSDSEETIEDFSEYNKSQIIEKAQSLLYEENIKKAYATFSALTEAYDILEKAEIPELLKAWVATGQEAKDFVREADKQRLDLNKAIIAFKKKRKDEQQKRAEERLANYKNKLGILDDMRNLLDAAETEDGFKAFREVITKWKQVRQIPNEYRDELNKSFEALLNQYYDTRKLNQELFEVDRQKNLDAKIELIQKVEQLKQEPSIRKAMIMLKQYREDWQTTGPVMREHSEDIWNRFQKIMQEVYDEKTNEIANENEKREANLKLKEVLVEKAELAVSVIPENPKGWSQLNKQLEGLMDEWKTVGPLPPAVNQKIWGRFNASRMTFFAKRKEFFATINLRRDENLELKNALCEKAELLSKETHWKNTSEALQQLQEDWKTIGPVPDSQNDKVWKRFRAAFDFFYAAKKAYFESRRKEESGAIAARNAIIKTLEELQSIEDPKELLPKLKEEQKKWSEAGHVTGKLHFGSYNKYRALCDELYGKCRQAGIEAKENNFKEHLSKLTEKPNAGNQLEQEERRIRDRMRGISEEINSLENNKNFFAKTKNAQAVIAQFDEKIEAGKRQLDLMKKELNLVRTVKPKDAE